MFSWIWLCGISFFIFQHVDGAYWSLLPELLFYLLMGALFYFKQLKNFYRVNVILILFCIIHYLYPIRIFGKLLDLDYVLLFFIGICFYRLYNNKNLIYDHFLIFINLIVSIPLYQRVQPSQHLKFLFPAFF